MRQNNGGFLTASLSFRAFGPVRNDIDKEEDNDGIR